MRGSQVLQPVRTLKGVKCAVGDDVRHLEIFNYSESGGLVLDPFTVNGWDAFEGPLGDVELGLSPRVPPATIQIGDSIEYEIDQNGTWVDTGADWDTFNIILFGPFPLGPTDFRIRYRRGSDVSPPSDVKTVLLTGGGPEG